MQAAVENGTEKCNIEQEEDDEGSQGGQDKETSRQHYRKRGGFHDGPKTKAAKATQDS